jgi:hypothetical protein
MAMAIPSKTREICQASTNYLKYLMDMGLVTL